MAMAKKRKFLDPLEKQVNEARTEMDKVKKLLKKADLADEGEKVWLPFPGPKSCVVQRPPQEFLYCGRKKLEMLRYDMYKALEMGKTELLVTGHKGGGKSSLTRALAVELSGVLHRRIMKVDCPNPTRLVCFWYFNAKGPLAQQVKDALIFTFFEDEALVNQISQIEDCTAAVAFLRDRKKQGEEIWIIADVAEHLDTSDDAAEEALRKEARVWLTEIFREANFVVKVVSPGASEVNDSKFQGSPALHCLDTMLTEKERMTLLEETVLGWNMEMCDGREAMGYELAGYHPLSLSILMRYCNERARITDRPVSSQRRREHMEALKNFREENDIQSYEAEKEDASASTILPESRHIFLDDNSWKEVVCSFKEDTMFREIRKSVQKAEIRKNEIFSFSLLTRKFPGYVVNGDFCTPHIRRIYMEEASTKLLSPACTNEAWSNYVKERLWDPRGLNWVELGWLCKNFVGQLIKRKGLKLQARKIPKLQVVHMNGSKPQLQDTSKFEDEDGILLLPDKYFFKYIDFIIILKSGKVIRVYGGQVTMDPDGHRKTEKAFVDMSNIERWVGNVDCEVHYIYLCPERAATKLLQMEMVEEKYTLHTASFLESFDSIGAEERELLTSLAMKRQEAMVKRKSDKRAAADKWWNQMDPDVRRFYKKTDVEFLMKKGLVHNIKFPQSKPTKVTMIGHLLQANKMEGCGESGESCVMCASFSRELQERRKREARHM